MRKYVYLPPATTLYFNTSKIAMNFSEAIDKIPEFLSEHLQLEVQKVRGRRVQAGGGGSRMPDLVVVLDGVRFNVEYKHRSRAEQVGQAIRAIRYRDRREDGFIPLIVVPYMGNVGRKLCEDAQIPWMDLSGNAWIHAGSIRVSILGRENRFKSRGRPANLFAPKSARIVRILLIDFGCSYLQKELAELADVDPGHVSRVVRRLEDAGFVERGSLHGVSARDPDLLLDTWREEYALAAHKVRKGHLAVRKPEDALSRLDQVFGEGHVDYALTGLPAAWLYVRHAGYRLITLFVESWPEEALLEEVGWRSQEQGGNVWILRPNDPGVFYGSTVRDGFPCVSAVQAYLDLCELPERASEAAEMLRKKWLTWKEKEE